MATARITFRSSTWRLISSARSSKALKSRGNKEMKMIKAEMMKVARAKVYWEA